MLDDIAAARDAALKQIAEATTLDDVVRVDLDVLGKKGALTQLKTKLGSLGVARRQASRGQELNSAQRG